MDDGFFGQCTLDLNKINITECVLTDYKVSHLNGKGNENDLKEMNGRSETFRGSYIPDAIKMYNNNQKGNVIDGNNNITVKTNRKLFEYGNRTTTVKHAQLRMKCSLLSRHLYDLHVVESPACQCGFDF